MKRYCFICTFVRGVYIANNKSLICSKSLTVSAKLLITIRTCKYKLEIKKY